MIRQAFSRAAAKPEGSSGLDFLEAILRERPDLREQTAYFPDQGHCAHVVFIGDEVFKGPKQREQVPKFNEEYEVLKALEGKGLPIPAVTYVGKEAVFFGMTKMPGIRLGPDFEYRLTQGEQRQLAKDIVNFAIGVAQALPMQNECFAVHSDLNVGNILIDPETRQLAAIIDFGSMSRRDRDDLCLYCGSVSNILYELLQEEYELRKDEIPDPPPVKNTALPPGFKL